MDAQQKSNDVGSVEVGLDASGVGLDQNKDSGTNAESAEGLQIGEKKPDIDLELVEQPQKEKLGNTGIENSKASKIEPEAAVTHEKVPSPKTEEAEAKQGSSAPLSLPLEITFGMPLSHDYPWLFEEECPQKQAKKYSFDRHHGREVQPRLLLFSSAKTIFGDISLGTHCTFANSSIPTSKVFGAFAIQLKEHGYLHSVKALFIGEDGKAVVIPFPQVASSISLQVKPEDIKEDELPKLSSAINKALSEWADAYCKAHAVVCKPLDNIYKPQPRHTTNSSRKSKTNEARSDEFETGSKDKTVTLNEKVLAKMVQTITREAVRGILEELKPILKTLSKPPKKRTQSKEEKELVKLLNADVEAKKSIQSTLKELQGTIIHSQGHETERENSESDESQSEDSEDGRDSRWLSTGMPSYNSYSQPLLMSGQPFPSSYSSPMCMLPQMSQPQTCPTNLFLTPPSHSHRHKNKQQSKRHTKKEIQSSHSKKRHKKT